MTMVRASLLLVLACVPAVIGASAAPRTRHVYVSVFDSKNVPVTDLTAADVSVKENGKDRDVVSVVPASGPLQIAVLVDDNGTGIFRYALGKFIEQLLGRAEFAISTVTPQTMKLIDYTANAQTLSAALAQLNARPGSNDGGQLLDGIAETAQELQKREARRPIILALTVGGQEHSTLPAHHVLDKLRQSGASLHVLTVVNTALRSQPAATSAGALIGENMNLGLVLGDGPKQSGGFTHEIVAATGIANGLQQLAQMLRQQYLIEYTLPDGVTPGDKLSVSLKRKGLSIRAPTRIPDK